MAERSIAEPDSRIQETQFSRQEGISEQEEATNNHGHALSPPSSSPQEQSTSQLSRSMKAPRVLGPDLLRGLLMILQAVDHAAVSSGAWGHGQGTLGENDGQIVTKWNHPIGWTARSLTHLCAPGFMFLMGMGIVYFGRSRSKLGWSNMAMVKHFFVRAVILALVNTVLGLFIIQRWMIVNLVLLALAVDYFIVGLLWLGMNATEKGLTELLSRSSLIPESTSDERRPLLANESAPSSSQSPKQIRAATISFHIHNVFLTVLTALTIWLNIWMSPTHGHCAASTSSTTSSLSSQVSSPDLPSYSALDSWSDSAPSPSGHGAWFDFWFYTTRSTYIFSGFPPVAWLSFVILGTLYARLVLSNPTRPARVVNLATLSAGLGFLLLFAATRILHFGNLSEDCLHMPEHEALLDQTRTQGYNQYLASFRSFFYVIKYPPSPAYMFYSMGLNLTLLGCFGAIPAKVARRLPGLLVFGTCALFFYALHMPLYGVLAALAKRWFGTEQPDVPDMQDPSKPGFGIGDGIVFWIMWLVGLLILYPACRWYGRFKGTKGADSVWRFF